MIRGRHFSAPRWVKIVCCILGPLMALSCVPVKPYQRMYLQDRDMSLEGGAVEVFETNFESYREGASGANGGKTGGGCGCN